MPGAAAAAGRLGARRRRRRARLQVETARPNRPPSTEKVLAVEGLRRLYGAKVAVDGISFHVDRGEIVVLLGPNGAGKTTTIDMILGVLEPTAGTIRIEGVDVAAQRSRALERANLAAVYSPLPGNLSVV